MIRGGFQIRGTSESLRYVGILLPRQSRVVQLDLNDIYFYYFFPYPIFIPSLLLTLPAPIGNSGFSEQVPKIEPDRGRHLVSEQQQEGTGITKIELAPKWVRRLAGWSE